jgi:hypothetical protein
LVEDLEIGKSYLWKWFYILYRRWVEGDEITGAGHIHPAMPVFVDIAPHSTRFFNIRQLERGIGLSQGIVFVQVAIADHPNIAACIYL